MFFSSVVQNHNVSDLFKIQPWTPPQTYWISVSKIEDPEMYLFNKAHSVYLITLEPGLKGEMIPLYRLLFCPS